MKRCRLGNGETDCILCGEVFRFYHRSQKRCADCGKMTCSKCGLESAVKPHGQDHHDGSKSDSGGDSGIGIGGGSGAGGGFVTLGPGGGGGSGSSPSSSLLSSSSSFMTASGLANLVGVGSGMQGKGIETVWLCKICGEEKEMWRKSGAWFFKVSTYTYAAVSRPVKCSRRRKGENVKFISVVTCVSAAAQKYFPSYYLPPTVQT